MRTQRWIAAMSVLMLVAAALVLGQSTLATATPTVDLGLTALSSVFPSGGQADLEVLVGSEALGGYADLYATANGETNQVMTFQISEQGFVIHAPVSDDPDLIGETLTYQYKAYSADGTPLGTSQKVEGLVVEPDVE